MNAAVDDAMRQGMRELERGGELCECYAAVDNNGVLHPHFCPSHAKIALAERIRFGYVKYERAFDREQDAKDRQYIVLHLMRREDTRAEVVKVGRYWLVLASWGLIKTDTWRDAS